ncbi:MAG: crotonobetainyl-CoA hydratase, partial [Gammaproteobacteria bacterium]
MIPGDDEVQVAIDGNIMVITLNRPKANAIDLPTSRKLGEAFVYFRDNPDLKVAIITGAGEKIFCAGWDLKA